jgi:FAD-dependent urate hydroxylase
MPVAGVWPDPGRPMPAYDGCRDAGPRSLAELEARLARDLALLLIPPAKSWLEPRSHRRWGPLLDVAIIGAGMAGLAAAFALKRLGIDNVRLFDRAPRGSEGPWVTYARMQMLRSPPDLAGPALGLANLTFRAWFEAQFGQEAWAGVRRISRTQWMDYLRWYRRVLDLPVSNDTRVEKLQTRSDGLIELVLLHGAVNDSKDARRETALAPQTLGRRSSENDSCCSE